MTTASTRRSSSAGAGWLDSTLLAEVSSRSLGLLRIFAALTIYVKFASPWCAHRMDDHAGTLLLAWGVLGSAWFVVFGYQTRAAAAVMAACFAGLHLYYGVHLGIDKLVAPVQEFQIAVLLALTPCGRSLSVDRALEVRRSREAGRPPPPERVPWWLLELFVIQTATTYLWLGYDHLDPTWLDGSQLERLLISAFATSDAFVAHPRFHEVCVGLSWASLIAEAVIVIALVLRPLRHHVMWLAAAYVLVHLMAFAQTWGLSQSYLMMLVMLIACVRPEQIDALVASQAD